LSGGGPVGPLIDGGPLGPLKLVLVEILKDGASFSVGALTNG